MKAYEKLFLKILQKCLKVTARGCFAGSTSLAYIYNRPLDHLHRNYACDIRDHADHSLRSCRPYQ